VLALITLSPCAGLSGRGFPRQAIMSLLNANAKALTRGPVSYFPSPAPTPPMDGLANAYALRSCRESTLFVVRHNAAMPNIAALLKSEITRIARKHVREETQPL
jgi:hypothetical protein